MKKGVRETIYWVLAITAVFAVGLILSILIRSGKYLRREYVQEKIGLTNEFSGRIEKVMRELTKTTAENRMLLIEQYLQPTLPLDRKSGILNALETLSKSKEYQLYSVNRYGEIFIKVVFYYSGVNGENGQIPFLFVEKNKQLFFLEIP
ncbi:MAG: hypothetical protein WC338_06230 [Candidatus Ratteibacteria bacterium]|jgi:hypothetical protein